MPSTHSRIAAQLGTDFAQAVIRNLLLDRVPVRELARIFFGATRVELVLYARSRSSPRSRPTKSRSCSSP